MAVKAFDFTKDKFNETHEVYYEILRQLGIKDPKKHIEEYVASLPEEKRNGQMFGKMVGKMFASDDERRAKAAEILKGLEGKTGVSPYVKAYFGEMTGKFIPFDTVLTAGMMVGNGKSLQMGCGEGKTGVLSMAAFAKLTNPQKQVFLTSSTPLLAAEALDKLPFYEAMGIARDVVLVEEDGITRPQFDENGKLLMKTKIDKEGKSKLVPDTKKTYFKGLSPEEIKGLIADAYKSRLVSSDNATLMKHAMAGLLPKAKDGMNRELLADEADFVLLDSYRPIQRTKKMEPDKVQKAIQDRTMAYDILEQVLASNKGIQLYDIDDANQYVDFNKEGREKIVAAINEAAEGYSNIDKNQLYDYIYDALKVQTIYRENRDYQILNEGKTLVSEDRASGVSIDLPEGVKQALEIRLFQEGKYKGPISLERKVIDTINVQAFFSEYFALKHFVSGTLGIDSEEIAEELGTNFGVKKSEGDIYEIPPKGEGKRKDEGKTMYKTVAEKQKAIVENALEESNNGRPVLIGAVSEKELKDLKEQLGKAGYKGRILMYTAASENQFQKNMALSDEEFEKIYGVEKGQYKDYAELIRGESGKEGVITLGTSIIGRGTTIDTTEEIDGAGGIHVIIDGLHETSSRNQLQYMARTARGTNDGSTIEYFAYDDIPEDYRDGIAVDAPADEVYQKVYERVDHRTKSVRDNVDHFVTRVRELSKNIQDMPEVVMSQEQKTEAMSMLIARGFSIQNRALGVSDNFKENIAEYDREMEMFMKMYVAEVMHGPGFDEVDWMKKNNYGDKVSTFIPFSEREKKNLFSLEGVVRIAQEVRTGEVKTSAQFSKEAVETERANLNPELANDENKKEEGR